MNGIKNYFFLSFLLFTDGDIPQRSSIDMPAYHTQEYSGTSIRLLTNGDWLPFGLTISALSKSSIVDEHHYIFKAFNF